MATNFKRGLYYVHSGIFRLDENSGTEGTNGEAGTTMTARRNGQSAGIEAERVKNVSVCQSIIENNPVIKIAAYRNELNKAYNRKMQNPPLLFGADFVSF